MTVIVGVARETAVGERRVALTPETCRKLVAAGAQVRIQSGIGAGAYFPDQAYLDAGAQLDEGAISDAEIVACVQPPSADAIRAMKQGAVLVGSLQPSADPVRGEAIRERGIVAFPLVLFLVWFQVAIEPPLWVYIAVAVPVMGLGCLLPLRPIKGWLVASQFVNKAQEAGTEGLWAELHGTANGSETKEEKG